MAHKQVVPRIICAIAALFSLVLLPCPASAADQTGTIQLNCTVIRDGMVIPLHGDGYALAQVATVDFEINDGATTFVYTTTDAFASQSQDWASLSDHQRMESAQTLAQYAAKNNLYQSTVITDLQGMALFEGLEPGLYLIDRVSVGSVGKDYLTNPFLVALLYRSDDTDDIFPHDVIITPKMEWRVKPGINGIGGNSNADNNTADTISPDGDANAGNNTADTDSIISGIAGLLTPQIPHTGSALLALLGLICVCSGVTLLWVLRKKK